MQQELLIAIGAGLGAMLGWGFADFFAKKSVDQVGSIVSLVWAHFFGTAVLIIIVLLNTLVLGHSFTLPQSLGVWGGVVFFGALQAIVYLFAYEGFGKGQLAVLNPIFASYSGLAALMSIVVYREAITFNSILPLCVIFIGVLFLSTDLSLLRSKKPISAFRTPGVKEVGLAALMAAFWQVFWDRFLGGQDWVSYTLLMYIFMTLTALFISKIKKVRLSVVKSGLWKFLVMIGICEVLAYLALSLGFAATSYTSIVIVLAGAFSLPTILLAHIFLKEKVTKIQTIGSFIVIIGIAILSVLR